MLRRWWGVLAASFLRFQSSPSANTGCYTPRVGSKARYIPSFQSSPSANTGCYALIGGKKVKVIEVSILTQCEHRVLPYNIRHTECHNKEFQSSPSANTGCYEHQSTASSSRQRFQSSPSANTGCYHRPMRRLLQSGKGFNPHPVRTPGATVLQLDHEAGPLYLVSILTQCEHRVLQVSKGSRHKKVAFQSSPSANTGCYGVGVDLAGRMPRFNPHPVRTPGATIHRAPQRVPDGGFNPHPVRTPGATAPCPHPACSSCSFNPHPVRTPGATPLASLPNALANRPFQSSPSANTGCYPAKWTGKETIKCFNPHPVRTPGATCVTRHHLPSSKVSILTQCEHRVLPGAVRESARRHIVSILTQCEHRVLHNLVSRDRAAYKSFNPHPVRTPGATAAGHVTSWPVKEFQSSPSANTGCYFTPMLFDSPKRMFQSSPSANTGCYARVR